MVIRTEPTNENEPLECYITRCEKGYTNIKGVSVEEI